MKNTEKMLSNSNRCTTECRKFSPNIFNKNKCTLCFGKREEHNPSALDYNRVSSRLHTNQPTSSLISMKPPKKTKEKKNQNKAKMGEHQKQRRFFFGKAKNSHKNDSNQKL